MTKRIHYGQCAGEYIEINSLSDEPRFAECMKLYKTHQTLDELDKALKLKAKLKMKLTY